MFFRKTRKAFETQLFDVLPLAFEVHDENLFAYDGRFDFAQNPAISFAAVKVAFYVPHHEIAFRAEPAEHLEPF